MSVFTLYIGNSEGIISHFRSISNDEIIITDNIESAEKEILDKEEGQPLIVMFEKTSEINDVSGIAFVKDKYPSAYLLLVTEKLEKSEIAGYQKAGLSDTISPDVSKERFLNGLEFVEKNQNLILAAHMDREPLGIYKCPAWKRAFDIFFSLSAIVILFPLLLITSAAIAIESRGPVIYKSKRVGSNYKIFDFFKFRSMFMDSDKRLKEFMALNQYSDTETESYYEYADKDEVPVSADSDSFFFSDDDVISEVDFLKGKQVRQRNNFVKYENDPRITNVGKILRKFSIDELPQLLNVLKGDMSIVGNRPLPLYEAEQLTSDQYIDRFMGPSGLTGLWQVEKRGDSGRLSPEERKQLDVFYAKSYSFWLDIKIIFRTFTAFVQKENV